MRHLCTLLLFLPFFIQAQSEAGQKFIEGSVRFSKSDEIFDEYKGFYVAPSLGYMLSSRFATGISFSYGYSAYDRLLPSTGIIEIKEQTTRSNLSLSPFVSWFKPLTDKMELSLTTSMGFGTSRSIITSIRSRSVIKHTVFSINIRPTFYYYLSKKIGISISFGGLGYSKYKTTIAGLTENTNTFNLHLRDAPFFGVRYIW